MELEEFIKIRHMACDRFPDVTEGKMMGSPAIHYQGKVVAFLSRDGKMVFKLGTSFPPQKFNFEMTEFNPFKNKGPLTGWYAVEFQNHDSWSKLTKIALQLAERAQK